MMYIAECLLTTLLIVLPADQHSTYAPLQDAPFLRGTCLGVRGQTALSMYVNDDHQLIVEYAFTSYTIRLPRAEGEFELLYTLGEQYAKYRMVPLKDPSRVRGSYLVDSQWAKIPVGYGPKGLY